MKTYGLFCFAILKSFEKDIPDKLDEYLKKKWLISKEYLILCYIVQKKEETFNKLSRPFGFYILMINDSYQNIF